MSVHIEREPAIEPIRRIDVSCCVFPKDKLTLFINEDGSVTAETYIKNSDFEASVEISSEDFDTILQAFAEIRRDQATSPF